ncbi:MAG: DUF433 domain-containing protein [Pseudomonadota bacterium]|nr:DUF433 domain-containing protein [Rhodocyclaceae bacterium]
MTDPREQPAYSIAEAASYLDMPAATLRSWVLGRSYQTSTGSRFFQPLIDLADKKKRCLSFYNLIEAFTLNAMRRTDHHISMPNIRKALDYVRRRLKEKRPLLTERFLTDGVDLFLDKYGQLVAVSKDGQLAMRAIMMDSLRHVRRDSQGMPNKLYLFTAPAAKPAAEIAIDPRIAFGNPVLDGTGISTAILAQRYKAGDSIDELAEDFGLSRDAVEQAIRYEVVPVRKAA